MATAEDIIEELSEKRKARLNALREEREAGNHKIFEHIMELKRSGKGTHSFLCTSGDDCKECIVSHETRNLSDISGTSYEECIRDLNLAYFNLTKTSKMFKALPVPIIIDDSQNKKRINSFSVEELEPMRSIIEVSSPNSFAFKYKDEGDVTILCSRRLKVYKLRVSYNQNDGKYLWKRKEYDSLNPILIQLILGTFRLPPEDTQNVQLMPIFPIINYAMWINELDMSIKDAGQEIYANIADKSKQISSGNFSTVVISKYRGEKVVIKIMKEKSTAIGKEIIIHSILSHPNILFLMGVLERNDELLLLLPFINGGSLMDHVKTKSYQTLGEIFDLYVTQMLSPLVYLESMGIIHRDVALRNYLIKIGVGGKSNIYLADFGNAWFAPYTHPPLNWRVVAPEEYFDTEVDTNADTYSFCLAILSLCSGGLPPINDIKSDKNLKAFYETHKDKGKSSSEAILKGYTNIGIELSEFLKPGLVMDRSLRIYSSNLFDSIPGTLSDPAQIIDMYSNFQADADDYDYECY
ncbi:MAG: hypothetical protein MHMPM18_002955 [Marteilia pararefringens]